MTKNITFSADEALIRKARGKAAHEHKSLNIVFREWIARYVSSGENHSENYRLVMKRLSDIRAGRKFTREEMNAR